MHSWSCLDDDAPEMKLNGITITMAKGRSLPVEKTLMNGSDTVPSKHLAFRMDHVVDLLALALAHHAHTCLVLEACSESDHGHAAEDQPEASAGHDVLEACSEPIDQPRHQ